jgi:hypothetical protein
MLRVGCGKVNRGLTEKIHANKKRDGKNSGGIYRLLSTA